MAQFALHENTDSALRLDRVSLGLAGLLFLSPWLLGYADMTAPSITAWISALVIAVVSVCATLYFSEWEEWANLVAGIWLIAAPWLLQFVQFRGVVASFIGIGLCVAVISLCELWAVHHPGWLRKDVGKPN